MTAEELLADLYPMRRAIGSNGDGEPWDGSCPCGIINGEGFVVEVHCWRASCEHGCKYSGVHVDGDIDRTTKERIAKHIIAKSGWSDSTEWNIIIL
jgi:hypothetical protein